MRTDFNIYPDTQADLEIASCAVYKDQLGPGYVMLQTTLFYLITFYYYL